VLGKYLGVLATMMAVTAAMLAATAITVWVYGDPLPAAFWPVIWLTWLEMAVVVGLGLLFSTFTAPVPAAIYAVSLLIAGHLAGDIHELAQRLTEKGDAAGAVLEAAYYVLPDLEALSLRTQAANGLAVPAGFVAWGSLYAAAYSTVVVLLAIMIFGRRRSL